MPAVNAFYFPSSSRTTPQRVRVPIIANQPIVRAVLKGHTFNPIYTAFVHVDEDGTTHSFRLSYRLGPHFVVSKSLCRVFNRIAWKGDLLVTGVGVFQAHRGIAYGDPRDVALVAVEAFLTNYHDTGELMTEMHIVMNPADVNNVPLMNYAAVPNPPPPAE
ncbi:hypothetical protein BKA70DRAFT_1452162 [Coprinopsis sp. MPI-PUGE-AT-0042]|nr:hypothetical protein BKA70DRAFT_1452162 [Coprinopsis sp. MPI-PUGE-AT-0042]